MQKRSPKLETPKTKPETPKTKPETATARGCFVRGVAVLEELREIIYDDLHEIVDEEPLNPKPFKL